MTKKESKGALSILGSWRGILALAVLTAVCFSLIAGAGGFVLYRLFFYEPQSATAAPAPLSEEGLSSIDELLSNEFEANETVVEEQAVEAPVAEAPAAVAEVQPEAPATTGQSDDNSGSYSGITPPFISFGDPVDTSNPIQLPPGLPTDFPTMSLEAQTQAFSSLLGLSLIPVDGEEGVAWHWNGKGVTTAEVTCPSWVICHVTLVDGNATVLFRGHGVETDVISAGTFRVERQIEGRGGLCFNSWMAQVYEASIVNILHILGEANQCPSLPAQLEERINPALGKRLREVMELTGANGVISIGTVRDGFGAFVIVQTGGPEILESFTCFAGASCAVNYGNGWEWVSGPVDVANAQGAVLYDLDKFANECEAFTSAQGALGVISNGPSCQD